MSDNNIFWKRTYEILIGDTGAKRSLQILGDEDKNEGLEIAFNIKKNLDNKEQSNTCTIDIYNLSEDTIKYIDPPNTSIIFKVGYKGFEDETTNIEIFRGIVSEMETDDRGGKGRGKQDRKTSLKCVPADSITYTPTISKTFPPNTTPRQIINYLVSQSQGITKASFHSDNIDKPFSFGYSAEGTVKSVLNELSRDYNFNYRLDGKRLYVNDPNRYESPNSKSRAFVISPETGLLGVPSYASSDGKKSEGDTTKKDGIKFSSLINPLLRPGAAVSIKDTIIEGVYRINTAEFRGSWRGGSWQVTCHCAKLNGQEV